MTAVKCPFPDFQVHDHGNSQCHEATYRAGAVDALREAADVIEAQLICCDVFDRLSEKHSATWTDKERVEYRRHSICYWGAASRRLLTTRADQIARGERVTS